MTDLAWADLGQQVKGQGIVFLAILRESLGIPRDSLGIPRDSLGIPRDSLGMMNTFLSLKIEQRRNA